MLGKVLLNLGIGNFILRYRKYWWINIYSFITSYYRARLPLGSDFPIEKVSPFLGLYSAVTRQDLSSNPPNGWYPEEK